MQTTLQLLHGPTKALVASALAGLAADLAQSSSNPALCFVQRPAYDDEAFLVRAAGQGSGRGGTAPAVPPTRSRRLQASPGPAPTPAHPHFPYRPHAAALPQSLYGSAQQRALATPKPKRPVGYAALAKLTTAGHVAFTVGRK